MVGPTHHIDNTRLNWNVAIGFSYFLPWPEYALLPCVLGAAVSLWLDNLGKETL